MAGFTFDKRKLRLKVATGLGVVNRHIKTAVKYADVVNNLTEAKSLRNQFFVGTKLIDLASGHLRDKVNPKGTSRSFNRILFSGGDIQLETNTLLVKYAEKLKLPVQSKAADSDANDTWIDVSIKGIDFMFNKQLKHETYVAQGNKDEEVKVIISEIMWKEFGPLVDVRINYDPKEQGHIKCYPAQKVFHSARSEELSRMVKSYLEKGMNRSLLLYGNPGTGKSNLALAICGKLFDKVLYFHAATSVHSSSVKEAVADLKPDAVILNEVDKHGFSPSYLETLEFIGRNCKLFIGTSNKLELPPALIRPGRFDDLIQEEGVADDVLENVLKFKPLGEVKEELKKWPVAFIVELAKRVEVEGGDFENHLKKMRDRLALNEEKPKAIKL